MKYMAFNVSGMLVKTDLQEFLPCVPKDELGDISDELLKIVPTTSRVELILGMTHLKGPFKLGRCIVNIQGPDDESFRSVLAQEALCDPESLANLRFLCLRGPVYEMKATAGQFLKGLNGFRMLGRETAVAQLNEAMVPKSVAGCNIYAQHDFPHHRTTTQNIVRGTGPLHLLKARVHQRILEDHATSSIYHCKNAEEMMRVLQDALSAHRRAYQAGILHRDVGDNTVLLVRKADDSVTGVLADWDMAMKDESTPNMILPSSQRQRYRKGTWYFMSARLLRDAAEAHTLRDDLESFFHLTLYLSIFWFPHTGAKSPLDEFVSRVFEEYRFRPHLGQFVGGDTKKLMFLARDHIVFETFQECYNQLCDHNLEPQLRNHDFMVTKFKEVLVMDGWSPDKVTAAPEPIAKLKRRYVDESGKPKKKKKSASRVASDAQYRPPSIRNPGASGSGSRPSAKSRKSASSGVPIS